MWRLTLDYIYSLLHIVYKFIISAIYKLWMLVPETKTADMLLVFLIHTTVMLTIVAQRKLMYYSRCIQ